MISWILFYLWMMILLMSNAKLFIDLASIKFKKPKIWVVLAGVFWPLYLILLLIFGVFISIRDLYRYLFNKEEK